MSSVHKIYSDILLYSVCVCVCVCVCADVCVCVCVCVRVCVCIRLYLTYGLLLCTECVHTYVHIPFACMNNLQQFWKI